MSACARDHKVGGRRKALRQHARLRCVDGRRRSAKTTEIDGGGVLARCWAMRGRVRECRWRTHNKRVLKGLQSRRVPQGVASMCQAVRRRWKTTQRGGS